MEWRKQYFAGVPLEINGTESRLFSCGCNVAKIALGLDLQACELKGEWRAAFLWWSETLRVFCHKRVDCLESDRLTKRPAPPPPSPPPPRNPPMQEPPGGEWDEVHSRQSRAAGSHESAVQMCDIISWNKVLLLHFRPASWIRRQHSNALQCIRKPVIT